MNSAFSLCHGVHVLPCQFDSHGNSSRSNGYQKLAVGSDSDMHTILWKGEGYGNLQVGATSKTGEGGMENDADINLDYNTASSSCSVVCT